MLRQRAEKEKMVCEENGDTKLNDIGEKQQLNSDAGSDTSDETPSTLHQDKVDKPMNEDPVESRQLLTSNEADLSIYLTRESNI